MKRKLEEWYEEYEKLNNEHKIKKSKLTQELKLVENEMESLLDKYKGVVEYNNIKFNLTQLEEIYNSVLLPSEGYYAIYSIKENKTENIDKDVIEEVKNLLKENGFEIDNDIKYMIHRVSHKCYHRDECKDKLFHIADDTWQLGMLDKEGKRSSFGGCVSDDYVNVDWEYNDLVDERREGDYDGLHHEGYVHISEFVILKRIKNEENLIKINE